MGDGGRRRDGGGFQCPALALSSPSQKTVRKQRLAGFIPALAVCSDGSWSAVPTWGRAELGLYLFPGMMLGSLHGCELGQPKLVKLWWPRQPKLIRGCFQHRVCRW